MSTREDETEKSNLDVVKSYYKSLTLQKKYGTTGSIEMEHGAVYIGNMFNTVSLDTDWTQCPGDLDENGVRTGMGHLEIPNGSTYDGSFDKVMCDVSVIYTNTSALMFECWCQGLPNGIGVMRFADSSRYEGEFMQGWFHGYGVFSTIDGMKYEGEFRLEVMVSVATLCDNINIRGGRMWGHGLLTYSDGSPSSEGYFQESKFR